MQAADVPVPHGRNAAARTSALNLREIRGSVKVDALGSGDRHSQLDRVQGSVKIGASKGVGASRSEEPKGQRI